MINERTKKISFGMAVIVFVFLIVSLITTILLFKGGPHIPLLASTIFASIIAIRAGFKWTDIEEGIEETMKVTTQAILILLIIGTIIGTWMLAGIVPTMIYYGLKILSPGIFLVATCLICSIVSMATGSSWSTAGTIGVALMGVGVGLGIPSGMVAGAIISGAYFGDKMSPLSDTTNLAPAMAGANMFDHIKHMTYTTGPSYIIALIIYSILGMGFADKQLDTSTINLILETLNKQFAITPLLLIPPVIVILLVFLRMPAIPGLLSDTILGAIFAAIFQHAEMTEIIAATHYGFSVSTDVEIVDSLLNRGGISSMMWTVSLVLIAISFAGVVEKTGMIRAIVDKILTKVNSTGSLIAATLITSIFCNFATAVQYMALIIPGRMYKDIYREKGLHPKNLSRCLEDTGTLVAPLVPWSTDAAFLMGALGVAPLVYIPYALLNLINPIVSFIYGFTGFTIEKLDKSEVEKQEKTA